LQFLGFQAVTEAEGVGFEPTEAFTSPVFKTQFKASLERLFGV
jgi:hypothetical protein